MKLKQQFIKVAVSWGLLLAFMVCLRPDTLGVIVLIIPFILLFFALFSLWKLLAMIWVRYTGKEYGVPKGRRLGVTVCSCVVLFLVLQSLGQLTVRDILTVVALAGIGYLYTLRVRSQGNNR